MNPDKLVEYLSQKKYFQKYINSKNEIIVRERSRHSRNTIIYKLEVNSNRIVAKLDKQKSIDQLREEYEGLKKLKSSLRTPFISSLTPLAFFDDTGIILTKEEEGELLSDLIALSLKNADIEKLTSDKDTPIKLAANSLFKFYEIYGIEKSKDLNQLVVRNYLDFAPSNLLIREDNSIILFDTPEYSQKGSPFYDIGTFCFEISRCAIKSYQIFPIQHKSIYKLKFVFINEILRLLNVEYNELSLKMIRRFEIQRIDKVFGYYSNFNNYDQKVKEFTRYCIYTPILFYYKYVLLPKCYKWLEKQINE